MLYKRRVENLERNRVARGEEILTSATKWVLEKKKAKKEREVWS
jgi:hypothetical protein